MASAVGVEGGAQGMSEPPGPPSAPDVECPPAAELPSTPALPAALPVGAAGGAGDKAKLPPDAPRIGPVVIVQHPDYTVDIGVDYDRLPKRWLHPEEAAEGDNLAAAEAAARRARRNRRIAAARERRARQGVPAGV